jgi:L-lactate dehydrogenase complex protein LldF
MPDEFRAHIHEALADPNLQSALDANAERRAAARLKAFASLPEPWDVMRRNAHAVRSKTIRNLDRYLEQFIGQAQANGMIIHRAADAQQAVGIVLEIAREHSASLIAKSKTMVSEEIGLNHALEAAGLQVVETDLGEYIVQLRGEPPAHIITPAVHLRRGQVGETFHHKLGIPLTDDIPTMTAAARRELRRVFLEAEIGLSGVNFGVAESGTLCIVTNEGNGRMVTTLPPVHIALMGIERLVPTLDDLALMLALLPRSATGQKITVYTTLIHGPASLASDSDPSKPEPSLSNRRPLERHLILVDNGRKAMRQSPLAEALLCIRCGACLNACPVFREIGGHSYVSRQGKNSAYPGPIGSVVSPGLFGQDEYSHLARASSLCGACREACPVDIDLPKLLLRVRAGGKRIQDHSVPANVPAGLSMILRLYAWMAADERRFGALQRLVGCLGRWTPDWLRLPAFTGWGYSRDFPRPAHRSFRDQWSSGAFSQQVAAPETQSEVEDQPRAPVNTIHPTDNPRERFIRELGELEGLAIACDQRDLADKITAILKEHEVEAIMAWEASQLPPGLVGKLQNRGLHVTHKPDPSLRAGLTGAVAAVAETGTLVLPAGPGRPPAASLLPEIHLAVLHSRDIHPRLAQVLALEAVRESPSTALISGPSRTADIEMTLTIGVHGPGKLVVFLLD